MKASALVVTQLIVWSILIGSGVPRTSEQGPSYIRQASRTGPGYGDDSSNLARPSNANLKADSKPVSQDPTLPADKKAKADSLVTQTEADLTDTEVRQSRIEKCLKIYFTRQVDVDVLRPWSIMHGLIAFGRNSQVVVKGKHVNAAEYLCQNGIGNGMQILHLENGKLRTRLGPGVQGHSGQLLAILAQSNVPAEQSMLIEGKRFTVRDLIEFEKRDCRPNSELTFKLIGLSHYLEPGATWKNDLGENWDFHRLIREELNQPIYDGACGGTHRLMGFSFAIFQMEKRGLPLVGEYLNAARMVDGYVTRAFSLQNSDGSFSTDFFEKAAAENDRTLRCYTTGHILEWLAFTLPQDKMSDARVTAAVDYLLDLMLSAPEYQLDVGPRGHALHALAMYELKTFGKSSNHEQLMLTGESLPPTEPGKYKFDNLKATPASYSKGGTQEPMRRLPAQGFLRRR